MTIQRKLGKGPKKFDHRTLQFSRYAKKLIIPPVAIDHASRLPAFIGNMKNDVYGDCTVAAAGHMVQSWTVYAEKPMMTIPDTDIVKAYFAVSGGTDSGAFMLDVLNYWRKTGVGGEKIEAFIETASADLVQAKLAIQHFGSLYIGMALPDTNTFGPWDVVAPTWRPNPYNGHAVCLIAYDDATQMFKVATWGEIWNMSYGWFQRYSDESYAVLDDISIIESTGRTPEGFDMAQLQDDLNHIGDPVTPAPVPVPEPVPEPPAPEPVPEPVPQPPAPTPSPVPPFRVDITGRGDCYWVVSLDGVQVENGRHWQEFEATQHAVNVAIENPDGKVTITFPGYYDVVVN